MGPADGFGAEFLHARMVGDIRRTLWLLLAAVGCVLLIACANVANLLWRGPRVASTRSRFGRRWVRRQGRLILQLLTESTLLSMIGGLLGLLVGIVGLHALVSMNPADIPRLDVGVHIDWRVFSFTAVVSLLAGVATGLVPALSSGHRDLSGPIQDNCERSTGGVRHRRMHAGLVLTEISCALVLLVSGALFVRTLMALRCRRSWHRDPPGAHGSSVAAGRRLRPYGSCSALASRGVEQLKVLPGVEVAAAGWGLPLETPPGFLFIIDGRPLVDVAHGGGGLTPVSPRVSCTCRSPRPSTLRSETEATDLPRWWLHASSELLPVQRRSIRTSRSDAATMTRTSRRIGPASVHEAVARVRRPRFASSQCPCMRRVSSQLTQEVGFRDLRNGHR